MNKFNFNKPFKNKNFLEALKNSIKGIITAFIMERNIKIDSVIAVLVLITAFIIQLNYLEMIAVIISIAIVITAEIFNSAIENIVDLITEEYNERAKIIKDISSGAVLISSIGATLVALVIFINKYMI